MSEFSASSLDYNIESVNGSNKINIIDTNNSNNSTVQNNNTEAEFNESKELQELQERYEKEGIHFVYEENIIKSHPDINTNIIFSDHPEKLINFSNFEYNYKEKNFYFDIENYKLCSDNEYDEDYFFITQKIYSDEIKKFR